MNKYEQLSIEACESAKRTFDEKEKCETFAHQFAFGYKRYIEAPDENFHIVSFNRDLADYEVLQNITRPKVIRGEDNYWYFGFKIHYCSPKYRTFLDQIVKVGVVTTSNGYNVQLNKKYELASDYHKELESIFKEMFEEDIDGFSKNKSNARSIGFI